ncbi:hypothetical protein BC835DRAFT_1103609 [Cytidiella melzeri]|nr:hypothetical protein BC835DRAFT_1103609 [Cytidiella melzeri]
MTEYDYSPEGYERHLATQNRVSNWVQEQNTRMQMYTNPYTTRGISTPPSATSRRSSSRSDERSPHRSLSHASRPEPRRSLTTPAEAVSRSLNLPYGQPAVQATYYPQNPSYVSPPSAYQVPKNYRTYQYDGNTREIVLPPPRAGETYVIIPPSGRRIEVVVSIFSSSTDNMLIPSSQDEYRGSRSSSRGSSRSPISPKKDQPLLKRLFTGFGQPSQPSAKLSRSSTSHRSTPRRERTRSY